MDSTQSEEIKALRAIYGDILDIQQTNQTLSIRLHLDNDCQLCRPSTSSVAVCDFILPSDYPNKMPPTYEISCPAIKSAQRRKLDDEMQNIYLDNIGSPIMYLWIELLKTLLPQLLLEVSKSKTDDAESSTTLVSNDPAEPDPKVLKYPDSHFIPDIPISTGEIYEDRKSVFQGHVAPVHCKEDVDHVLRTLSSDKKIAKATHNIYAYRITSGNGLMLADHQDDGEHAAGGKLAHLLEIMKAENVIVIVTRWYGGIHLGTDRFRIINEVARQQLVSNGFDKRQKDNQRPPTTKLKNNKKKLKRQQVCALNVLNAEMPEVRFFAT